MYMCYLYHGSQEYNVIDITSAVKCIPLGFTLGNTFNCMSGTNPYTPESHGTGYMYPNTHTLLPSTSMLAHFTRQCNRSWQRLRGWLNTRQLPCHRAEGNAAAIEQTSVATRMLSCGSTTRTELVKAFQRLPNV